MKTSAIVRIIIWTLVACLLIAALCVGLTGDLQDLSFGFGDMFRYADAERYETGNGQTDESIHTVDIHWVSGPVSILPTEDDALRWEESSSTRLEDKWQVRYLVDNGVLHLQFRESALFHAGTTPEKALTVYLPSSLSLREITVENVSGDITLTDLAVVDTALETVSGNMRIDGLRGDSLDTATVSGEIRAEQVEMTAVDTESVSGNTRIEGTVHRWSFESVSGEGELVAAVCPQEVDGETVSGDIALTLPDNDGFTVEADGLDKRFECDFPVTAIADGRWEYQNGGADLAFDSVSGRISIRRSTAA